MVDISEPGGLGTNKNAGQGRLVTLRRSAFHLSASQRAPVQTRVSRGCDKYEINMGENRCISIIISLILFLIQGQRAGIPDHVNTTAGSSSLQWVLEAPHVLADSYTCVFVCARIYPAPFYSWIPSQVQVLSKLKRLSLEMSGGVRGFSPVSCTSFLYSWDRFYIHDSNSDKSVPTRLRDASQCHAASQQVSRRRESLKWLTADRRAKRRPTKLRFSDDRHGKHPHREKRGTEGGEEGRRRQEDSAREERWMRSRNTSLCFYYISSISFDIMLSGTTVAMSGGRGRKAEVSSEKFIWRREDSFRQEHRDETSWKAPRSTGVLV